MGLEFDGLEDSLVLMVMMMVKQLRIADLRALVSDRRINRAICNTSATWGGRSKVSVAPHRIK